MKFSTFTRLFLLLSVILSVDQVQAQSITSSAGSTTNVVTTTRNLYNITGGDTSKDGINLFHSFHQFGLKTGETANFIASPTIQNILGRVVGGNASVINGSIQITGSNANLFLINPMGIIFGNNASLNLPASFTATTANKIGFGSQWLNSLTVNNYLDLTGTPNTFAFVTQQPGSIINTGNLSVKSGANLNLLAGSVINTGELSAPEGQIVVTALKGENLVRLSQVGNLLSLELEAVANEQINLSPLSLPQLLTGAGVGNAKGLTVNSDGTIVLTGSGISISPELGIVNTGTDISTQGGSFSSISNKFNGLNFSINTNGISSSGRISIISSSTINTGNLITSAFNNNAGNVILTAPGKIQVNYINAQALGTGNGGLVNINTLGLFQSLDTFTDKNGIISSISSADNNQGGAIILQHGGGLVGTPLIVGNATDNGTAGAITSSLANTIALTQSFPSNYTLKNIQIITSSGISGTTNIQAITAATRVSGTGVSGMGVPGMGVPGIRSKLTDAPQKNPTEKPIKRDINIRFNAGNPLRGKLNTGIPELENRFSDQFKKYLSLPDNVNNLTSSNPQETLNRVESITGIKPAIIYVFFSPKDINSKQEKQDNNLLEVILVTAHGKPIRKQIMGVNKAEVLKVSQEFSRQVTSPIKVYTNNYLDSSQQLYKWLITPLESELQIQGISNLTFIADKGLRFIPLAALHDGKQFLIEKYSVGLMPSLSLTDTSYTDLKKTQVLAMGASKFTNLPPLPAVPQELAAITQDSWVGKSFLNQDFTLANLKFQRHQQLYGIIHLATHGEFKSGSLSNSYIQLWERKLQLDQIRQLGWNHPPVELLVLSACRTALGNEDAELGFAGLAVQAGVKSAIASLWNVSDTGTLVLMSEFYRELKTAPIKAEALRRAQIAMVKGQTGIGKLSPMGMSKSKSINFSHPYYWAAFTMIGSPW